MTGWALIINVSGVLSRGVASIARRLAPQPKRSVSCLADLTTRTSDDADTPPTGCTASASSCTRPKETKRSTRTTCRWVPRPAPGSGLGTWRGCSRARARRRGCGASRAQVSRSKRGPRTMATATEGRGHTIAPTSRICARRAHRLVGAEGAPVRAAIGGSSRPGSRVCPPSLASCRRGKSSKQGREGEGGRSRLGWREGGARAARRGARRVS